MRKARGARVWFGFAVPASAVWGGGAADWGADGGVIGGIAAGGREGRGGPRVGGVYSMWGRKGGRKEGREKECIFGGGEGDGDCDGG